MNQARGQLCSLYDESCVSSVALIPASLWGWQSAWPARLPVERFRRQVAPARHEKGSLEGQRDADKQGATEAWWVP